MENSLTALATLSGTPLLDKTQSTTMQLEFESSTNRMEVIFRSDDSVQARGFQAR